MKILLIVLISILNLTCQSKAEVQIKKENEEQESVRLAPCPITVEHGKIYGNHGTKVDMDMILVQLQMLVTDICAGNLNHLSAMIFDELGLFIDAKGHWTKEEVMRDITLSDGYFATYFFDQKLLDKKKGTSGNLTLQMAIRSSHGLIADYFFDSARETEIQLRFKENPKNVRYLINPVFAKIEGRWMLLRMF
jgi:hypothetical protein